MTRSRKREREHRVRAESLRPAPVRRRWSARRAWITFAAALVVAVLAIGTRTWQQSASPEHDRRLADSLAAAVELREWATAAAYGEALAKKMPRNSALLDALAGVWHNRAFLTSGAVGERSPFRTSLERWRAEQRALRYADSAAACASTTEEKISALYRRATLYDVAGMHADALEDYRAVVALDPRHTASAASVAGITARMKDPSHGDTITLNLPATVGIP